MWPSHSFDSFADLQKNHEVTMAMSTLCGKTARKFDDAVGADQFKALESGLHAAVESDESDLFAFSPQMSYVPENWDQSFWGKKWNRRKSATPHPRRDTSPRGWTQLPARCTVVAALEWKTPSLQTVDRFR